MFCRNCGKEIPDGVRFCNHCGASQEAGTPQNDQTPPSSIPSNQNIDEKALLPVKDALFVVNAESKLSEVANVVSLIREYDINLIGTLFLGEIRSNCKQSMHT